MSPKPAPGQTAIPLVAIGASAGGLQALESFFRNMPRDNGMAFVVAMHLSRDHVSQLASILQGYTTMPVVQVSSPTEVEPDHVYVIAPDQNLMVEKGGLESTPRQTKSGVIDSLFRSLAEDRLQNATGILLSGTGSDGTDGMRAIHERGGLLLVQDPEDAEYPSMPHSVIDTGIVDYILPAHELPERLVATQKQAPRTAAPKQKHEEDDVVVREILTTLLTRTGYDFNHYKRSTLHRQIMRRMVAVHADDIQVYARLVHDDEEAQALFQNLLISVTRFFRDPKAFAKLERDVLPKLFRDANLHLDAEPEGIRVWVPGCATGEEVFSLAMLLVEMRDTGKKQTPVQILATDIDEAALVHARRRLYTEEVTDSLSPERIERFFIAKDGSFRIRDELRALVVFSLHDLTRDPPFTRIDLLSCRNVLMYFSAGMKQKILKRFAYSIRPGGFLFLGAAEGIDTASRFFTPVSKTLGLFRRTHIPSSPAPLEYFPSSRLLPSITAPIAAKSTTEKNGEEVDPTQDELVLANQEMQSLNEELRSMMEELEVAKEELQSLNEELITVNQELQNKIEEHRRVNNDLHVLIESTNLATLFLDRKLNVELFTPESTKLYNLLPVDVGRPLEHISHRLVKNGVLDYAREVLKTAKEVSREVQTENGTWYIMRAMPYASSGGPADGVVLTFTDITLQKKVEQVSEDRFALAFHAGPMAAGIITQEDEHFIDVNTYFEKIMGYSRNQIIGKQASEFGFQLDNSETRVRTRSGALLNLVVSTTAIDFGGQACYLSLFYDVTERKRLEREILLVSDREQRRIGVDLHDGLGAHLTGISLMARGLARKLRSGRAVDSEEMEEVAQLLGEGIEQARSLAQGLNPFLLDERGLAIALAELAANMEERTGTVCTFDGGGHEFALSSEESMHLYRIAQEAVTNATRHGKADKIRIAISKKDHTYRLSIHDNGIGFQPDSSAEKPYTGMGLNIMRYRAELIGAKLVITGSPDHGTTVLCTFTAPANL